MAKVKVFRSGEKKPCHTCESVSLAMTYILQQDENQYFDIDIGENTNFLPNISAKQLRKGE